MTRSPRPRLAFTPSHERFLQGSDGGICHSEKILQPVLRPFLELLTACGVRSIRQNRAVCEFDDFINRLVFVAVELNLTIREGRLDWTGLSHVVRITYDGN